MLNLLISIHKWISEGGQKQICLTLQQVKRLKYATFTVQYVHDPVTYHLA